jgi:hypothetical protein
VNRGRRKATRAQAFVEFALVAPLFFLLLFGTIDFGGYFGSRLSVEEAARAGARVAEVQCNQTGCTYSGSAIVTAIVAQEGMVKVPTTVNCTWQGTTLAPDVYPPFTFSGSGCIGIWYFNLYSSTTGPPELCGQWSVTTSAFVWYTSTGSTTTTEPNNCVVPVDDIVVVGVGYHYTPLTPLPTIASNALTTYGETQLLEEGNL